MQSSQELHFFSHIESVMFFSVRVNRSTDIAPYHKMNIDIMGVYGVKGLYIRLSSECVMFEPRPCHTFP